MAGALAAGVGFAVGVGLARGALGSTTGMLKRAARALRFSNSASGFVAVVVVMVVVVAGAMVAPLAGLIVVVVVVVAGVLVTVVLAAGEVGLTEATGDLA